jgi:hypothetical protein
MSLARRAAPFIGENRMSQRASKRHYVQFAAEEWIQQPVV